MTDIHYHDRLLVTSEAVAVLQPHIEVEEGAELIVLMPPDPETTAGAVFVVVKPTLIAAMSVGVVRRMREAYLATHGDSQ